MATYTEHVLPHNDNTTKFFLAGRCYVSLEKISDGTRYTYEVRQKVEDVMIQSPEHLESLKAKGLTVDLYESYEKNGKSLYTDDQVLAKVRHPFWFVGLQKGSIGDSKARYLGVIDSKVGFRAFRTTHATKKNKHATADNINLFGDVLKSLETETFAFALKVRVWHMGRCAKCGKALSVPESIATGFGPICAKKLGIDMANIDPSIIEKLAALADHGGAE